MPRVRLLPGIFNWLDDRVNPGTYHVRGLIVDLNGNSVEVWAPGTLNIPSTPGGLNLLFYNKHNGQGLSDCPTCDDDNDGLTNAQEQFYGTNPEVYDTDGGGVGDGIEVAKGGNPLDPSDDMNLPIDKYGTWFLDNVSNYTTYYMIKNTGDAADIVDVTFDQWLGISPTVTRNTVELHVPAHGYIRFTPRQYTTMNYGSMYVRSLNQTSVGYMDVLTGGPSVTDASQSEDFCYLQDPTSSSNTNLYVPFCNDLPVSDNSRRTNIVLKNLDMVNSSTGALSFAIWQGVTGWAGPPSRDMDRSCRGSYSGHDDSNSAVGELCLRGTRRTGHSRRLL